MTATMAKFRRVETTPPDLSVLCVCSMLLSKRCREHRYWKVAYEDRLPLNPADEPVVILAVEDNQETEDGLELFAEWRGKSWSVQRV